MSVTEREGSKHTTTLIVQLGRLEELSAPPHHFFRILFCVPYLFLLDLGLPDRVEDMCPLLPSLEQALGDVEELAGAGAGAGQAHYIHVTEVTLPMLCSYMSRWWLWGPEGHPACPIYTSVIPQNASDLLGNILRIIHDHVGTSQGDWMKQLAGIVIMNNAVHIVWLYYTSLLHNIVIKLSFISQFSLSQSYVKPALSC